MSDVLMNERRLWMTPQAVHNIKYPDTEMLFSKYPFKVRAMVVLVKNKIAPTRSCQFKVEGMKGENKG
jgi:hypothetical protein